MNKRRTSVFITSDGVDGVIVTEDGQTLEGVTDATIWISTNEIARVDLSIVGTRINIKAQVHDVTLTCPFCDHTEDHECPEQ